ncbi:hypothetical protein [Agarivorans aestuarii]|uniref:Uncharacterized protein n=1 Tax=Agarivorans aestuarii TaxID=1563703 RepID=A0ABU7G0Q3_9ALTE|nr:hypothetical protein [Agarivorans aestuarii]MEE1672857.1 hypothetical protein [Agarivorans aestuarii]
MKKTINFKEHSTEAASFVAFTAYLQRDSKMAAKVSTLRMLKTVCRINFVDYKKIENNEYEFFSDWIERYGLYVHHLYEEIIAIRDITVSLHQPKERFLAQAERIFSAVLNHAGRDNFDDNIGNLDLALARLHYEVLKTAENEELEFLDKPVIDSSNREINLCDSLA